MATMSRRALLATSGVAPLVGGLFAQASSETKPQWVDESPRETIRNHSFPNVLLRTHEGKEVHFYDDLLKDKIVVISFMYTNCSVTCPITTHNLVRVQKLLGKRMGRDIFMYSITITPEQDTPAVLRNYANHHGVGPGWLFLTGAPEDIEMLRGKLGFYKPKAKKAAEKKTHVSMVRFGNEPRQLWAACSGVVQAEAIAKAILVVDWPRKSES